MRETKWHGPLQGSVRSSRVLWWRWAGPVPALFFPFSSFPPRKSLLHTFYAYPTHTEIIKKLWRGSVSRDKPILCWYLNAVENWQQIDSDRIRGPRCGIVWNLKRRLLPLQHSPCAPASRTAAAGRAARPPAFSREAAWKQLCKTEQSSSETGRTCRAPASVRAGSSLAVPVQGEMLASVTGQE